MTPSECIRYAHTIYLHVGVGGWPSQTWDGEGERPKAESWYRCTCGELVPSMEEHWKKLEDGG